MKLILFAFRAAAAANSQIHSSVHSVTITDSTKYLFYLHGAIVQEMGIHAVSKEFGAYEYLNTRTRTDIYRSSDNGSHWIPTRFGDNAEAPIFVKANNHIFASTRRCVTSKFSESLQFRHNNNVSTSPQRTCAITCL